MKEQDRRMMQLPNSSVSHGDRRRKKEERKARLVMMVAPTQLRLALEAEDERRNME